MKIYSVTMSLSTTPPSYNLVEHDADAPTDPTNRKPIGRKFLAKGLTYDECNRMKRDLDFAQGSHPLQMNLRNPIPEDAKPPSKTFFLPTGSKKD